MRLTKKNQTNYTKGEREESNDWSTPREVVSSIPPVCDESRRDFMPHE